MIPKPGDANREVNVTETFHLQTDDELSDKELKQIEADDQAIQTILLGLLEDIYAAEKKAKLFNEWEKFTSNEGESIESYYHHFLKLMNDLKRNKHFSKKIATDYTQLYDFLKYNQKKNYPQQPMPNPEDITYSTTAMNIALALMAKAFKLNYSTSTNNNQRISSNPRNRQIAQPGMNMGQDRQMQLVGVIQNAIPNPRVQNVGNQNGLIGVQENGNQNQIGNGNLVAALAEGNATGKNGNQIRCYNCKRVGHYARNCTIRPRRRDAAYLQTQLLIAQKEEAGIQLQAEEYDLMAAAVDLDEIEEVNANCILMANMQQASTSGNQTDSAPVYDTDGSTEVHENCINNEIFNMFTQEEQYTELLEPILESHQVPQNDNVVISEDTGVEQGGETVEQHPINFEETRALYESLYQNLAIEVEKVNSVNCKLKETNADMPTELARYKNQERLGINFVWAEYFELWQVCGCGLLVLVLSTPVEDKPFKLEFASFLVMTSGCETVIGFVLLLVLAVFGTCFSSLEVLEGLILNIPRAITLSLFTPLGSCGVETEFEVTGFDKAFDSPTLERFSTIGCFANLVFSLVFYMKYLYFYPLDLLTELAIVRAFVACPCNSFMLDSQDVISKVVCATCKKCLISINHDKCLRNYVNDKKSRGKKQKAKVFVKEIQKKYQPKASKKKQVGTRESLATPKLQKSRLLLRWSPTGKMFNKEGKIVDSSESKSKSDCSNGDNACTSNILELKIKQFPNFTSLLNRGRIRRDACFVRNLEGVDLLKGDRSTNLYTINLHDIASTSPICLMACASSTKSWLWHQRLSHLNFDTINDLARNDLVAGLLKFKYHKEHLCPSSEQGKKQKSISSTKTSSKFEAEITSSSYGFV
uniref:Integrase, catalytic region, zinc finger, CCHC-type, peptidase aspartic, catalytic n=1 Tax=Tanacetum cinerariifolium TaxID=118510 RepID=A0A6L2JTM0_TANCI|nr:integrase, catalytic region, zinc finger, CCHC-type, peptidase aspartic, catalytic [Tanacetum cinerariifolium]